MNLTSYHSTISDVCIKIIISTLLGIIYLLYTFFFFAILVFWKNFKKYKGQLKLNIVNKKGSILYVL